MPRDKCLLKKLLLTTVVIVSGIVMKANVSFGFNPIDWEIGIPIPRLGVPLEVRVLPGVSHSEIVKYAILGLETTPDISDQYLPIPGVVWSLFPDLTPGVITGPMEEAVEGTALGLYLDGFVYGAMSNDLPGDPDKHKPEAHFDNDHFAKGYAYIKTQTITANILLHNARYDEARVHIGKALHAIHDFYAHTNWLELHSGALAINPVLIPPYSGSGSQQLGPVSAPIEEPCLQGDLQTEKLTSGYYGNYRPGHEAPYPPGITYPHFATSVLDEVLEVDGRSGKCIHGGDPLLPELFLDSYIYNPTGAPLVDDPHAGNWGINKDTHARDHSPSSFIVPSDGGLRHKQAAILAVDATRHYLMRFAEEFRNQYSSNQYSSSEAEMKLRSLFGVFGVIVKNNNPNSSGGITLYESLPFIGTNLGSVFLAPGQSGLISLDPNESYGNGGIFHLAIRAEPSATFLYVTITLPPGWVFVNAGTNTRGSIDPANPSIFYGSYLRCSFGGFCQPYLGDILTVKTADQLTWRGLDQSDGNRETSPGWALATLAPGSEGPRFGAKYSSDKDGTRQRHISTESSDGMGPLIGGLSRLMFGILKRAAHVLTQMVDKVVLVTEASAADLSGSPIRTYLFFARHDLTGNSVSTSIPVDSSLRSITIKVDGTPDVVVLDPLGQVVDTNYPSGSVVVTSTDYKARISNPSVGEWTITRQGTGIIATDITGVSNVAVLRGQFGSLAEGIHPGFAPVQTGPIVGSTSTFYGELSASVTSSEVQLRSQDGTVTNVFPITLGGDGTEFILENVTIPTEPFYIYAHGFTANNEEFLRLLPSIQRPTTIDVVSDWRRVDIEEQGQTTVLFTVTNHRSTEQALSFTASPRNATIANITPGATTVPAGSSAAVSVTIAAPDGVEVFSTGAVVFSVAETTGGTEAAKPLEIDVAYLQASNVAVPAVTGLSIGEAETLLGTVELSVLRADQPDETVPSGTVLSQDPAAGFLVRPDSIVNLVVSSGPPTVPALIGSTLSDVRASLNDQGLSVGAVTDRNDAVAPVGVIVDQFPAPNTHVATGSAVDLVVSLGPVMVPVPDVVGQAQVQAESAITGAGLAIGTVTLVPDPVTEAGRVISQVPEANTQAPEASEVHLIVSLGPPVMVPNLVGLGEADAVAALSAAGVTSWQIRQRAHDRHPAGIVAGQIPAGGTTTGQATVVLVDVSTGSPIRSNVGFTSNSVGPIDEGSTGLVPIGFPVDLAGTVFSNLYVNNNGSVSFDASFFYTFPGDLYWTGLQILYPFYSDVDTRFSGSPVTYGRDAIDGRAAFGVNWVDVDYYLSGPTHTSRNSFQLVLIDRADIGVGAFDLEFNYGRIEWESGQYHGGDAQGLGGMPARAGMSYGGGTERRLLELLGSGVNGGFLDSGPLYSSLVRNSFNSQQLGRHTFYARNGVVGTVPIPRVVGMPVGDAEAVLVAAGLTVGSLTFVMSATVAEGVVVNQDLVATGHTPAANVIDLMVSLGPPVSVPDIVGLSESEAAGVLAGAGLSVGTVSATLDAVVPAGRVVAQTPGANAQVAAGTPVDVVVSLGPPVTVPNVVGLSASEAAGVLAGAGLSVGTVSAALDAMMPAGQVVAQMPVVGVQVAAGALVDLVVSLGPPVTVPDVVGLSEGEAGGLLTGAGLSVGAVSATLDAVVPAGQVVGQDPAAGAHVAAGTSVNLVVSLGAPVTVPSVVGVNEAEASAALAGAGLSVGAVSAMLDAVVPAGQVVGQAPGAGAQVAAGTFVNLVVSLGAPVTVPSVVGVNEAEASAALAGAGLSVGAVSATLDAVVPAGQVVGQAPGAGAQVAAGTFVNLVVSLGAPVTVPSVVGVNEAEASAALAGAGLSVGAVSATLDAVVPAGQVVGQNPGAGLPVAPGTRVDLVVSLGLPVTVPGVVGLNESEAAAALAGVGLSRGIANATFDAVVPAGQVVGQAPGAGAHVAVGTPVDLVVSLGPPVSVPNVVGLTEEEAIAALAASGIHSWQSHLRADDRQPAGAVGWQSPEGGRIVGRSTTVLLGVSTGSPLRPNLGFTANTLERGNDGSSAGVPIGFPINFFGQMFSNLYVNNNGNITFSGPLSAYPQFDFSATPAERSDVLTISPITSSASLAATLAGPGVTISNVTYSGVPAASGTFAGGIAAGIGIESGILLTTGLAANLARGPNTEDGITGDNGAGGYGPLAALIPGFATYDATVLGFDFVSTKDTAYFNYVFGSEEYNEYVGSEFNDVFGFFFGDGTTASNVALIPGTTTPVSINNVNNLVNSSFYNDNDPSDLPVVPYAFEYDGFTDVFTASLSGLTPGATYHIDLAIADAGDSILDSGVFIQAGSFSQSPQPSRLAQMIAPFFADVDTREAGLAVTYGQDVVDGRPAFGVNWSDVDYFHSNPFHTKRDTFQLVLIDRSDIGPGDFDIEFNYGRIEWEAGQVSGGDAHGLGGASARVGFSDGTESAGASFELPGSAINGALLDSGPSSSALVRNSLNSQRLGRYVFYARNGIVSTVNDQEPPSVTAPVDVTIAAAEPGGATGNAVSQLAVFLSGGSAVDSVDAFPQRLAPLVGGVEADLNTLFPLGTTPVTFRFRDAAGNLGSATANVTVALGQPRLSGMVVGKGVQAPGVLFVDVRFSNTGTGNARNVSINQVTPRTLSGSGMVTYNSTLSPALPNRIGSLDVGASTTVRFYLNVPSTVTRFSLTESGTLQDVAGTGFSYSIGQSVIP